MEEYYLGVVVEGTAFRSRRPGVLSSAEKHAS